MKIKLVASATMMALMLMASGLLPGFAAEPTVTSVKVAILPFSMHTPGQLMYLQDGVRDMLTSRLGWEGKVQVLDRTAVDQAVRGMKADITPEEAQRLGRTLKSDYVVFGSLTGIGQVISIDAKMLPLSGKGEPLTYTAQTKSLDDIVPQINLFAQEINQKVFSRPAEKGQTARSDEETYSTRNPELLVPTAMVPGEKISYLNPNFIEVTPESSLRQGGLWRSQDFSGGIVGMDVGDLDGDGRIEVVMATQNRLMIYRKEGSGLRAIATHNAPTNDRYLWVSVLDLNRDGRAEIFLTNLRTLVGGKPIPSQMTQLQPGYGSEILSSQVLTLAGSRLQMECENLPFFLNAVELPKRGKVLLGQQKGSTDQEGAFDPAIHEMQLKGKTLSPLVQVHLPSRCNVFNFAKADLKGDGSELTILIDNSNHLLLLNAAGDQVWKSDRLFAPTTNSFVGKIEDLSFNQLSYYAIPSPVLVTDLNRDGIPEIVVNRCTESLSRFMPQGLKFYDRGEIVSLSWDQIGLIENWKTRELNGMISGIRVADLNNDGSDQLLVSLLMAKDYMKFWESKSTLISYSLNLSGAKKSAKQQ